VTAAATACLRGKISKIKNNNHRVLIFLVVFFCGHIDTVRPSVRVTLMFSQLRTVRISVSVRSPT
jgi:hypothetical protein